MGERKAAAAPKGSGKLRLAVLAVAPLLLLLGGGAGAAYVMGAGPFAHPADAAVEGQGGGSAGHGSTPGKPAQFVDLPDIIVNLDTGGASGCDSSSSRSPWRSGGLRTPSACSS